MFSGEEFMRELSIFFKSFLVVLLFTVFTSSVQAGSVESAKNWLVLEVNSGALSQEQNSSTNTLALATQSSKQSTLAMEKLDSIASLDTQLLLAPFDVSKETNTTEYMSAKILIDSLLSNNVSAFTEKLLATQHKDGGFGHTTCHSSTALDTL